MNDWEVFQTWTEFEGIDLDRLDWLQVQRHIKQFEDEQKHLSFNYKRALDKLNK